MTPFERGAPVLEEESLQKQPVEPIRSAWRIPRLASQPHGPAELPSLTRRTPQPSAPLQPWGLAEPRLATRSRAVCILAPSSPVVEGSASLRGQAHRADTVG